MNIVAIVLQYLTPDLVAKMASVAGISDRTLAQKAIGAAVPAILSGAASLASKPEGARRLADAITKQSPMENLGSLLAVAGSNQLVDTGKDQLSSLLGGSSFSSLASAIGKFAGIGGGAMGSLLGMLTPVVLGVLGREAGAGVNGLTQLLTSQKDNLAAAMPAGLSHVLRASGFLDETNSVASMASRTNETYRTVRDNVDTATARTSRPSKSSNWVYWGLPLFALAGLAWYLFSGDSAHRSVTEAPSQAKVASQPTGQGPVVGGELQSQVVSAITSLNGTLRGLKDQVSAAEALPKLQQAAGELDRLSGLANRLPIEARDRLAESIKTTAAQLKTALENVNAMPGLASDVKPVIATLRTKLDALLITPGSVAQQRIGVAADKLVYLARSPNGATGVSTYVDRNVYNNAGEKIGVINDLVIGPDASIAAAVIGVGGFLGIGEKEIAVPFSGLKVMQRDNDWHVVIDATMETLRDAPAFEYIGAHVRLSPGTRTK